MAKEIESSKTETQKIINGESEQVTTVVVEEEMEKLTTTKVGEMKNTTNSEGEELKNSTIVGGENLNNTITVKGEDLKKVKLTTSDHVTFEVELSIVKEMETVQSFLNSSGVDNSIAIPLPNVTSRYLSVIIKYCVKHNHVTDASNLEELREVDKQFMEELNTDDIKELILIANYLNMKNFFEFMCTSIANNIKNKSVEFVRNFFGLTNDFVPRDEAEFREVNAWAFQNIDRD